MKEVTPELGPGGLVSHILQRAYACHHPAVLKAWGPKEPVPE